MPPESENAGAPAKLALDAITSRPVDNVSDDPDDCTTLEQLEILKGKAELDSFKQDTGERKRHAKNIFKLTCVWVAGIYLLLLFQGFGGVYKWPFHLSDSLMLAAIGSTTANIIGVFYIVVRYFFPRK